VYRIFSSQDDEIENAHILRRRLDNLLFLEEARGTGHDAHPVTQLKVCREELAGAAKSLATKEINTAWSRPQVLASGHLPSLGLCSLPHRILSG
jgi:hypothetical protein